MSRPLRALLTGVVAALVPGTAAAASADEAFLVSPAKSGAFPERAYVLTLPRDASLVPGALDVRENGEPVSDLAVTPTSAIRSSRMGVVLLIDTSNSMRGEPLEAAFAAARAFAMQRNANQRLAVITFDDEVRVRLPFTTDRRAIDRALAEPTPPAEGTALYDAIVRGVDLLRAANVATGSLVMLSDGADVGSTADQSRAVEALRAADVRLFAVGLESPALDPTTLDRLSSATGASFAVARSEQELQTIYGDLGATLANEYLVEYRSLAGPSERVAVSFRVRGFSEPATLRYVSPKLDLPVVPQAAFRRSAFDRFLQADATMYGLAGLVAVILVWVVATLLRPQDANLRGRLARFVSMAHDVQPTRHTALLTERVLAGTDRSLRRTQWWPRFKEALEVAEIRMPAEQIVVLTVIGTLAAAWLLTVLADFPYPLLAALVPGGVYAFLKYKIEKVYRAFEEQLPDNLEVIASALRAGHSLLGALSVAVDDSAEPSKREFRRVLRQEQLGVPLEEALDTMRRRMRTRDLEQVSLVAALARQTGGDSAEVLDRVTENVRARAEVRRLVRVLTAQGRLARWVLTALPAAFFLLVWLQHPEYLDPLLHERVGQVLLVFGLVLLGLGSLALNKIVKIKV